MCRLLVAAVILFSSSTFVNSQSPQLMQWNEKGYFSAEVPEGLIYVEVQSPIVYVLKGSPSSFGVFAYVYRMPKSTEITLENLRGSVVKDGYFTLDGSVVRVSYNSKESANVKVPDTLDGVFRFPFPGKSSIILDVGKSKLEIPISVVELKVSRNDPAAAFVENYGEPDSKEGFTVSWPNTEVEQTILYSPKAGEGPIIATHWRQKRTPNLVLSIVDSKVYDVGSVSTVNSKRMLLENLEKERLALEQGLKQMNAEPAQDPRSSSQAHVQKVIQSIILVANAA